MKTQPFQPISINTVIDSQSIQRCIEPHYPCIANGQMVFPQAGVNDTYIINTTLEKFVFRLYRFNLRSTDDIKHEVELLQYFSSQGGFVSEPIAETNQQHMISIDSPEGTRYGELFSFVEGHPINYQDDDGTFALKYFMNLAHFHQVSMGVSTQSKRHEMIFFDFDCYDKGWLEYDLATYYWAALHQDKKDRWEHFMAGYSKFSENQFINLNSVHLLMAIRQFWLLSLDYESLLLCGKNYYNKGYIEMNTHFLLEWKKRYQEHTL